MTILLDVVSSDRLRAVRRLKHGRAAMSYNWVINVQILDVRRSLVDHEAVKMEFGTQIQVSRK
jgi:hypothetical protein